MAHSEITTIQALLRIGYRREYSHMQIAVTIIEITGLDFGDSVITMNTIVALDELFDNIEQSVKECTEQNHHEDFYVTFDNVRFRIIHDHCINVSAQQVLKQQMRERYLFGCQRMGDISVIPFEVLDIDWNGTLDNLAVSGKLDYGTLFALADGTHHKTEHDDWNIFTVAYLD